MFETQARELAASIKEQFPHVETVVVQAADMRNAPQNWFIGVYRQTDQYPRIGLHIHSKLEWQDALDAAHVLGK